jgi:hypothetical protein
LLKLEIVALVLLPLASPIAIAVESLTICAANTLLFPACIKVNIKILLDADDGVMVNDSPVTSVYDVDVVEKVSVLVVDTT